MVGTDFEPPLIIFILSVLVYIQTIIYFHRSIGTGNDERPWDAIIQENPFVSFLFHGCALPIRSYILTAAEACVISHNGNMLMLMPPSVMQLGIFQ